MDKILKILPYKVLIKLLLDVAKIIASKTKTKVDDEVILTLLEVFGIILPILDNNRR